MDHDQLLFDLKHAPSVKLLKRDNAPLIIGFLHRVFKHEQIGSLPFRELVDRLEIYLEALNDQQPALYPLQAAVYLKQWSEEEYQILRIITRGDQPTVELTVEAERAIGWIEELHRREFVGAESRFRSVFQLLEEIVAKSTDDVDARLRQLEDQRDSIQREIDTIRATGQVIPSTSTQIRERFLLASEFARQITRDFAEVEQNFRAIARAIQERQLQPDARKGQLIGDMLDADAALHESDQGRSFYAFWEFLRSPSKQDELDELLKHVYSLPALRELVPSHPLLHRITRALIDAGDKIVQSNHRLAEQVRRLLDDRALAESRRARELIAEIKHHALRCIDAPPDDLLIAIDGDPNVQLIMDKPLWEPRAEVQVNTQPLVLGRLDQADQSLRALYQQFSVNEAQLRRRIDTLLETCAACTLGELLEQYPPEKGLAEIIAYLSIAAADTRHTIDSTVYEEITLAATDRDHPTRMLTVPKVVFRSMYAS